MSLAERLAKLGFNQDEADKQLLQVVRGQTIVSDYNKAGELTGSTVTVRHKDAALGLMVASALGLTDHQLTPTVIENKTPDKEMVKRFAPKVDNRIIARRKPPVVVEAQATPETPEEALKRVGLGDDDE